MTEFAPSLEPRTPNIIRKIADLVMGVDPEIRRSRELIVAQRNQQEREVASSMVSEALAWGSRRETPIDQPKES